MTPARTYQLSDAERTRAERIDELVVHGDVDALIAGLSDPSWTVRRATVSGLASFGDHAVAALVDWLRDRRTGETEIAAVVDALVASSGTSVDGAASVLLEHERPEVAADAAQILGRRRASTAVAALSRAVEHANDNVAVAAIEALGAIGGSGAIDTLIAATRTDNFFRVFAAIQVLARIGDPRVIEPLVALLANPLFRAGAVRALGQTGSVQAVEALAALRDDDATLEIACAFGDLIERAQWNGSAEHVERVLREATTGMAARFAAILREANDDDARRILRLVGRTGGIPELTALAVLDDHPELRTDARDAMQRIVRRHEDALPDVLADAEPTVLAAVLPIVSSQRCAAAVRDLLAADDDAIRALACQALARIGDIASVPLLFAALENPRPAVALAAASAIQSLGAAETEARTIRLLREGSPSARRHALRIASYMGFANAFDAIVEAIHDRDARIAELAITTLGALDHPRIDALLEDLLAVTHPAARRAAAMRALSHRPTPRAHALLQRGLDDELPWVRYYACQGIGRQQIDATGALIARLRDRAPHVRLAAIEALSQLDTPDANRAVLAAAGSTEPDELRAALLGIGSRRHPAALPVLLAAAESGDVATQIIALTGLASFHGPEALACLAMIAARDVPEVRDAAVSLLAEWPDRDAADALVELVLRFDPPHPAHHALERSTVVRIDAILARCHGADERTAQVLTAVLARMHDAHATRALFGLLATPDPILRRCAASVLIQLGEPGAREAVGRMSREDPDPAVRRVCAAASEGRS